MLSICLMVNHMIFHFLVTSEPVHIFIHCRRILLHICLQVAMMPRPIFNHHHSLNEGVAMDVYHHWLCSPAQVRLTLHVRDKEWLYFID